ncbi:nucleolar protein 14-like [Tropilaelaps mercedesae]|uniref:Nucleolar protein 14-like n=1 Tax=Tropilaelaps mercedesae TaxID=418985 RepID=A0A1V9XM90_9ACAR|nr:nucleolar protein 14-like [Tropilaelaps mercedesae]
MAKHRTKAHPDRVTKVRPKKDVKKNPFEVKLNRQKHQVINRKFKSERGLPGVARDRAISKRKATLLKEYLHRNKDTVLLDRRIGEGDAELDPDEKMARRLARESARKNKRNLFNLNDDEVLTHLGQSIEDARAEDDPRSDDEDLYDKLDAAFVNKAHFGGFLTNSQGTEESRKRAIDELIAESKRLKHERQVEVDENFKLTEELDSKWRDVSTLLSHARSATTALATAPSSSGRHRPQSDAAIDSFDALVSELQYAPRAGVATERTKDADELAKEERERLEVLERQRLARARGEIGSIGSKNSRASKRKHRSADDLDDGFALQADGEDKEGEDASETNETSVSDEENAAEADDKQLSSEDDDESEAGSEYNEGSDEEDTDSYDDLKSDSDSDVVTKESHAKQTTTKSEIPTNLAGNTTEMEVGSESLTKDIPYLIAVPENMNVYYELVRNRPPAEELLIVNRVINGNAPSLHEKNKRRLEDFLRLLLDRVFIVLSETPIDDGGLLRPEALRLIDGLVAPIHSLTEMSPIAAGRNFVEIIRNVYQGERVNGPKKDSSFPGLEKLIMFKLVSICFSVSDQKHAVATPALICMAHMLTACKVTDGRNMLRGIFVAQLMLEYVAFAGKYVPEVVGFIRRLLSESQRLTLSGSVCEQDLRLCLSDLYCSPDMELPRTVRCKILFGMFNLISLAADVFAKLPSFPEVFSAIRQGIGKLETSYYPESLKRLIASVTNKLSQIRPRGVLCRQRQRPQMLKMYEPLIEERVDMLRKVHRDGKSARAETKKLKAKYKKELKSAMREIRRDNQFIAHHKLKEQLRLDADRKMKVKRLFGELANQQGELNSLQKLKGKKK